MRIAIPHGTLAASAARLNSRFFSAAIFLCVLLLVGVAASALFLRQAMEANARQLLAADLRLQAALPIVPGVRAGLLPDAVLRFARQHLDGAERLFSPGLEFSAMARVEGTTRSLLVEVKAVAADYPLRGRVQLEGGSTLSAALADGVVVEKSLLSRLGLRVGDALQLGERSFAITAALAYEPDRITHLFSLGPRLLIALDRVASTGLIQAGSRVTQVVSIRLGEGEEAAALARSIQAQAKEAGIQTRTPEQSQPSVRRFIRRFVLFLALTALLTLLVGGMAMTGAMAAFLRESRRTIAILKLLGANTGQMVLLVMWSTLRMVWAASLAAGVLGVMLPGLLPRLLEGLVPAEAHYQPSVGLALAGSGLGIVFSLLCAAGPLWWSRSITPAQLFRSSAWGDEREPSGGRKGVWLGLLLSGVTLCAALAIGVWSGEAHFGLLFVGGLVGLLLLAWAMVRLSLWGVRCWRPRWYAWQLAIHALLRRGEGYETVMISLGIGLGLVAAVLFLEDNLNQQLLNRMPQRMPSYFFIDIQPDQLAQFQSLAAPFVVSQPDAMRIFPTVRGRLLQEDQPVVEDEEMPQAWRKSREYVLTCTDNIPVGNRLVAGQWWVDPTVREASVEVEMAKGLGLGIGDLLSFNIQGVTITARITSLRAVRWSDLGLNFFVIFSPSVLQDVPLSYLASVVTSPDQEEALLAAISGRLHNVTAIATRVVLERVQGLLQQVAQSARLLGGGAVVAGLLVLGVSVAASRRRRAHEMTLYRLLGASRWEVARIAAVEFMLLGLLSAAMALLIGQAVTALAVEGLLNDVWGFNAGLAAAAFVGGTAVIALTGWVGSYREMGRPVMALLRGKIS
ncbi:MAG: hypothetical protein HQL80_04470 [Magnetococcales bacterium]|nr:hypothetical protein [Magnetococcales bacterium]